MLSRLRGQELLGLIFFLGTFVHAGTAAAGTPPRKEPDAVLAVVTGNVTVTRGDRQTAGAFGLALQGGDSVETAANSSPGIIFSSGQIIDLGTGSRITVGSVPNAGGDRKVMAQVPDALAGNLTRFAQTASGEQGLSALPELRAGGEKSGRRVDGIAPRRTLIETGTQEFQWTPVDDAIEYSVHLAGPGAAAGDHRAAKNAWTPAPEMAFKAGEHWTWSVEAVTADGSLKSDTYEFEVAPDAADQAVKSLEQRLEPLLKGDDDTRADAARYLLGSYCRSMGF